MTASRDYGYGRKQVTTGQVFELKGFRNDGLLLKHRLAIPLEPQPDAEALKRFPQCGECGRHFRHAQHRERCGKMHELSAVELKAERREVVSKRLDKLREAGQMI